MATRNRRRDRAEQRYRIILHTGDIKVVGLAQWKHHLEYTHNLTRNSDAEHHRELFARDSRIALVAPGLIAFEDESKQGELRFEAKRGLPAPPVGAQSQWRQLLQHFLLKEPTLPGSIANDRVLAMEPRLKLGDAFAAQGQVVIY